MSLRETAKKFEAKLKKIKVVAFDLDGILTDAHVWWASEEVGFNRTFNIYDGYGMKTLMKAGLKVGVITGGNSVSVTKRTDQLGVSFCYIGNEDKRKPLADEKLTEILKERGYNIARRTVAKYREQMNIPVARLRKEL